MKILAIDTSTVVSSVALIDEKKLYCEITINSKTTNHSERLMSLIDEALHSAKIGIEDIDLFSCNIGPGSFTGLRISIATIKGLAQSLDKAVIGASTLKSLAYNLPYTKGIICPVMDAQRDELYTCLYRWEDSELIPLMEESVLSVAQLLDVINGHNEEVILLGDGLNKFSKESLEPFNKKVKIAPVTLRMPKASSLAHLSLDMARQGQYADFSTIEPNYMRKSQAEVQLEQKQNLT